MFRRHLTTIRKGWIVFGLSVLISVGIHALFPNQSWTWGATGMLVLICALYLFYLLILRHFSVYILTNVRIRQISQNGLFKKNVIDLKLSSIQSVSYQVPGLFGDVLKYGTIMIRTDVGDLRIDSVRDPEMVYSEIQEAVDGVSGTADNTKTFEYSKKGEDKND